ncbi:NF038120 family PEP-CTERM protein [Pelomonas cellulosilytica]|uniref:NF038120 family PEP-CTERM protein n=1 Tax=Pelomonas cellulosilytica TaxID=2906762 RepID=A0ABS8XQY9_9BURK|nr:NF038120 family PEP-CTERM protein [Pelomonas sp. P8]MCE4553705.1 NF038120 family PEP-CTERM protein [Pelomonas sp. P8]
MKKVLTSLALAVSALTLSATTYAGVLRSTIDFETPIDGSPYLTFPAETGVLGSGDEFYQPGMSGRTLWVDAFSNSPLALPGRLVGSILSGACADLLCPSNNSSSYVALLDDAVLAFGHADGFTFSVRSLSASFIGNGDPVSSLPGFLALQGVRDGASLTAYYALTGLDADGHLNFATIDTGAFGDYEFDYVYAYAYACTGTVSGSNCSAFSTNEAQFALDDIVIEHVPEPASLALVGLAGLALVGARRRRAV